MWLWWLDHALTAWEMSAAVVCLVRSFLDWLERHG